MNADERLAAFRAQSWSANGRNVGDAGRYAVTGRLQGRIDELLRAFSACRIAASQPIAYTDGVVKRALPFLLLLGALFGLLGQQTAAAASAIPMPTATPAAAMSDDCMEIMGQHPAKPEKKLCGGITLDCISATGCAMPLTRDLAEPLSPAPIASVQVFWPTSTVLVGLDLVPEPHPPTILG
jgi:hypothetical protein